MLPTRRMYAWLAAGVMVFAIYASVLPFRFRWLPFDVAVRHFTALMMSPVLGRISRTNFLANVLLFVPVGFGIAGAFLLDRRRRVGPVLTAVGIGLTISLAVSVVAEFLQEFVPGRVPTRSDVEAQAIGFLIGCAVWLLAGQPGSDWLRVAQRQTGTGRIGKVLVAYAVLWALVNLAPFDITLDLGELAQRYRAGLITVTPFSGTARSVSNQIWDMLGTTLSAVPLGALGVVGWSRGGRKRGGLWAFAAGAMLVCAMEAAQVFIVSHAADITDALFGLIGVAAGVVAATVIGQTESRRPVDAATARGWPIAAVCGWCAVLMIYHWMPYDFQIDTSELRGKLARLSPVPFVNYARGSDLNALNDLLVKLGLSVPLGVFMAFVPRPPAQTRAVAAICLAAAAGIFLVVEGGQLFLPTRSPDLSDVLVGVVGTAAGMAIGRWVRRG